MKKKEVIESVYVYVCVSNILDMCIYFIQGLVLSGHSMEIGN